MRNRGKGFIDVSATAGQTFNLPILARGAAFGDLNNDGQMDIVIGVLNGAPVILRNNGTKNHWLGIRLVGSNSNLDGSGAPNPATHTNGHPPNLHLPPPARHPPDTRPTTIA